MCKSIYSSKLFLPLRLDCIVICLLGKELRALFISTVRTDHTCREVERLQNSDSPPDFQFLTDPELLNTAFTRAQSLVAVVGDADSLCTIGNCQVAWEELIKRCRCEGKFFESTPHEITASGLNVSAPAFTPDSMKNVIGEGVEAGPETTTKQLDAVQCERQINSNVSPDERKDSSSNTTSPSDVCNSGQDTDDSSSESDENGQDDFTIEKDAIIRAYREECRRTKAGDEEMRAEFPTSALADDVAEVRINARTETRLLNLGYTRDVTQRTMRLLHQNEQGRLGQLPGQDPDRFVKCRLRIDAEGWRKIYGEVLDTETKDILIKGEPMPLLERDTVIAELSKEPNLTGSETNARAHGETGQHGDTGSVVGKFHNNVSIYVIREKLTLVENLSGNVFTVK